MFPQKRDVALGGRVLPDTRFGTATGVFDLRAVADGGRGQPPRREEEKPISPILSLTKLQDTLVDYQALSGRQEAKDLSMPRMSTAAISILRVIRTVAA